MIQTGSIAVALAFLWLGCPSAAGAPGTPAGPPLGTALGAALGHPGLRGARVGVLVVREADGEVVFARAPDRALVPASNLKILTGLAALEVFGPSYRFVTRVWSDAPPDATGAVGWLALEGGGDPALSSEQWWRLAADLRRGGLRRVREGLLLDDSGFDGQRWLGAWGEIGSRAYHAPVGALVANYGAFAVEVRPGPLPGTPASVSIDPPVDYLELVNRGRTGRPRSRLSLAVDRSESGADRERVSVRGALPAAGEPRVFYRSVAHPTRYAGAVARLQLEAAGVRVSGPIRLEPVPADAHELLAFEGHPVGHVVELFMKFSNNLVAEMLLKGMARERGSERGDWESGRLAVRESLARMGIPTRGLELVDGSGLAQRNRVTPRTLVEALRTARRSFDVGPELVASLPIAGADGTLKRRAGGAAGAVRAKTGLLDGVTGLSGYARHPEHGELVFSILVNGYRGSDEAAMAAVDGFAAVLAGGPRAQERIRRP